MAAVSAPDALPRGARGRRVVVATLTYRRPVELEGLLPELVRQCRSVVGDAASVDGVASARVLVVDNDPGAGARATVEDAAAAAAADAVALSYAHEPRAGIAHARNRALDEAADDDVLVFLDDDERPGDGWLAALLALHAEREPSAVVGPVESVFVREPDAWVRAGAFFVRRRLTTGEAVTVAATNNLLLDLAAVRSAGLRFDPAFGLSGAEDTLFTKQLVATGGRILWCAEAPVTDLVPAARVSHRWVVARAFSSGNSASTTSLALAEGAGLRAVVRAAAGGRGALRCAGGLARIAAGIATRSLPRRARGVRTLARGAGMLAGAVGYRYAEYRRPRERTAIARR